MNKLVGWCSTCAYSRTHSEYRFVTDSVPRPEKWRESYFDLSRIAFIRYHSTNGSLVVAGHVRLGGLRSVCPHVGGLTPNRGLCTGARPRSTGSHHALLRDVS